MSNSTTPITPKVPIAPFLFIIITFCFAFSRSPAVRRELPASLAAVAYMIYQDISGGGAPPLLGPDDDLTIQPLCGDDNLNDLFIASRNTVNNSVAYMSPNSYIQGSDGEVLDTQTLTAGSTLAYSNSNVPCTNSAGSGTVKTLATAVFTSGEGTFSFAEKTADTVLITNGGYGTTVKLGGYLTTTGANTTNMTTDTNFANIIGDGGTYYGCNLNEDTSYGASTVVGSGESFSRYLDIKVNESNKQFGGTIDGKPGILITINNNNSAAFRPGDIVVSMVTGGGNLQKISCNDPVADQKASTNEAEECYVMDGITAKDTVRRIRIDGTASSGNPGNNVIVRISDIGYVEDTDGSIVWTAMDSGGTDVGVPDCTYSINLS